MWISEIMLQQTRVEAVKPFFERFISALPDVEALAVCPEDKLLKLWEGLGYYNRARNLQKAARLIMEEHEGEIPADYGKLLALPGIGHYTAGAIGSIAFGLKVPAVDGNVLRVLSRVQASFEDVRKQSVRSAMEQNVQEIIPKGRAGDFNQALIELGALVCVPNGKAKCGGCPLSFCCQARQKGLVDELPRKKAKKERRVEERTVLVLREGERAAIRKRPLEGLLAGLYELPNLEGHLSMDEVLGKLKEWGLSPLRILPLPGAKHLFSHVEWRMTGYAVSLEEEEGMDRGGLLFIDVEETEEKYPIPAAFAAYARYMDISLGQERYKEGKVQNMFDSIIIGAGVAGSVAARELAEAGRKVLVLEQRNHIGGNCYDELDEHGILVHKYGPHIFHTKEKRAYDYLSRFTDWHAFGHEVVANVHGKLIPVPFNLNTLHMVYGKEEADVLEQKLVEAFGEGTRVPILKLREQEDAQIREIADYVYENIFLHYTMKQWGQTPEEIDPAVTGRVPVLISHDNRYFQEPYQGMPLHGYTPMFERMLDHPNITVETGVDARERLTFQEDKVCFNKEPFQGEVVYTGPLDELFGCRFGRLPYRSLRFEFEYLEQEDFQGHSVVNYTVSEEFTRITEFKYLTGQKAPGTTIVREYPFAYTGAKGEIPYYSIANEENQELYEKYKRLLHRIPNVYLLGRLAEYKYYNIDAMTMKALELTERLMNKHPARGNKIE